MSFRTGTFDRGSSRFRAFTPAHAANALTDLDLADLHAQGKRLILMDVDNTLVHHNADVATPEIAEWIAQAKGLGFDLCIVSNTNRLDRLATIAETLGVASVRGRFKPSRSMFDMALEKFDRRPEEALMVGDQLMTDVLGANRAGIDAVWVAQMPGSREFVGTRVNRLIERFLQSQIYKSLVAHPGPSDEAAPVLDSPAAIVAEFPREPELQTQGGIVRQIGKFLIVGATSFVIDFGITFLLWRLWQIDGERVSVKVGRWLIERAPTLFSGAVSDPANASLFLFVVVAATVATYNGFYWNRRWTFRIQGDEGKARQLRRVYVLGYIALGLNAFLSQIFHNIVAGHAGWSLLAAKIMAAACCAAFNFLGQRFWAFR